MNIRIERPTLNRATPEENLAIVDKWIADTSDKLNMFISQVNRDMEGVRNAGGNQITS
ncbi:MAG: hypothetical protein IKN47_06935 [Lachnospiraceae bacterium]|nr:hypothetical protein [Lachnospiraceae bacterium]